MNSTFIIQNLVNTGIFKRLRNLFTNLCDLDLDLIDLDGRPVSLSDPPVKFSKTRRQTNPSSQKYYCQHCNCSSKNCFWTKPNIFKQVLTTQQPEVFSCVTGHKRIVVPIVVDEMVIGFLHTGENFTVRLNSAQVDSILTLLQKLVNYIIKNELRFFHEFKGSTLTHQQKLLKKVINHIWDNYHQPTMTLQDISKQNGISYHYLSRLFKRELKTSFVQYRNKVRLDVASRLLKDCSLTISQISYSCGFDDPGYFCKVFKESFGAPPVNFRKKSAPARKGRRKTNL